MRFRSGRKVLTPIAFGSALGFAAGLLAAPKPESRTQKRMIDRSGCKINKINKEISFTAVNLFRFVLSILGSARKISYGRIFKRKQYGYVVPKT